MANQRQLGILKQGVDKWNAYRQQNPHDKIDLSDADLSGSNLSGAYLNDINLDNANLSGASLDGANLTNSNLVGANLSRANLMNANLKIAMLQYSDISDANLSYSNLSYANLSNANLIGANLEYAKLERSILEFADLEEANLSNANFTVANLNYATLIGANINEAKFDKSNLYGADIAFFKKDDFKGARFDKYNQYDSNPNGTTLEQDNKRISSNKGIEALERSFRESNDLLEKRINERIDKLENKKYDFFENKEFAQKVDKSVSNKLDEFISGDILEKIEADILNNASDQVVIKKISEEIKQQFDQIDTRKSDRSSTYKTERKIYELLGLFFAISGVAVAVFAWFFNYFEFSFKSGLWHQGYETIFLLLSVIIFVTSLYLQWLRMSYLQNAGRSFDNHSLNIIIYGGFTSNTLLISGFISLVYSLTTIETLSLSSTPIKEGFDFMLMVLPMTLLLEGMAFIMFSKSNSAEASLRNITDEYSSLGIKRSGLLGLLNLNDKKAIGEALSKLSLIEPVTILKKGERTTESALREDYNILSDQHKSLLTIFADKTKKDA